MQFAKFLFFNTFYCFMYKGLIYYFLFLPLIVVSFQEPGEFDDEEAKKQYLADIGLAKIYVINLDRRTDKLKSVKSQLDYLNLPFTRFSAIDGQIIKECYEQDMCWSFYLHPEIKFNPYEYKTNYKENEWAYPVTGLWLSHLQIYFEIFESNNKSPVLILEDDVIVSADLAEIIKNSLKLLTKRWDLFFLSYAGEVCKKRITKNLCQGIGMVLTSGYIVNGPTSARKLIELSNNLEFIQSDFIWRNALNTKIFAYFYRPIAIEQDRHSFPSDLNSPDYHIKNIKNPAKRDL